MPTVLFVCTGNTCRSPMAAALFEAYVRSVRRSDVRAESAGLTAMPGSPAPAEARAAVSGTASLEAHRSRRLDREQLARADLVVGMTREHARRLREAHPDAAGRTIACADLPGGSDVHDPFLGSQSAYDDVRRRLEALFPALLVELDHCASRERSERIRGEGEGKSGA